MKTLILPAVLFVSSIVPVFAITNADITPAALAGRTITFTISSAGGAFANTGSWTGKFGNPTFTVTNISGNTVNITTTHSTAVTGSGTKATLPQYIAGSGTTTIVLYITSGIGRYEMNFSPVTGGAFQLGTFTIGSAPEPEIGVKQASSNLTDGVGKKAFGTVKVGQSSGLKTFTIKNTGSGNLTGIAITKSGAHKTNFIVSSLTGTSVAPGGSATFKVKFSPTAVGIKNAVLHISSNDSDENPFEIKVTGKGKP
jgi:hypothetical protein